jgi:hypothetical protein
MLPGAQCIQDAILSLIERRSGSQLKTGSKILILWDIRHYGAGRLTTTFDNGDAEVNP